jgi:hypothetical protein
MIAHLPAFTDAPSAVLTDARRNDQHPLFLATVIIG